MSNELTTPAARPLDEFDRYTDVIAGADEQTSERAIQGQLVRFTNQGQWMLADETLLTKKLVVANVRRCLTKWGPDNKPETRFLAPGELVPDVEALNEAAPRSEWREGPNGQPQGPYVVQQLAYMVDPVGLDKFTFPTSTIGGGVAVRDLIDRILWLRRLRGNAVYPLVQLTNRFMNTRWGGRPRPHFEIVQWITLDPSGGMIPTDDPRQLPPQQPAQQAAPKAAPQQPVAKPLDAAPLRTVEPPSVSEDLNDKIPW
jgi:hypothetical protein